jgi:transcriptional regulator with XRE-family HTH domain
MNYADSMKAARKNRGCSRKWLARKSGVSDNTLYEYETGRHEPGIYNLIRLATVLEISIDEYIGRRTPWQTSNSNAQNAPIGGASQQQEKQPENVATTICTPASEE